MSPTPLEHDHAIRQLSLRYAQAIDSRRFDQLRDLFTPQARLQGPGFDCDGIEEFISSLDKLAMFSSTLHCVHNQLIEFESDSQASGHCYCIANHLYEKDGVARKLDWGICYHDRYHYQNGQWRITERRLELRWQQDLPLQLP
jgi:hypothetical protein